MIYVSSPGHGLVFQSRSQNIRLIEDSKNLSKGTNTKIIGRHDMFIPVDDFFSCCLLSQSLVDFADIEREKE